MIHIYLFVDSKPDIKITDSDGNEKNSAIILGLLKTDINNIYIIDDKDSWYIVDQWGGRHHLHDESGGWGYGYS